MKAFSFLLLYLCLFACKNTDKQQFIHFRGSTMGTTYSVKYVAHNEIVSQSSIDSLLTVINQSVSTYIANSTISQINRAPANDTLLLTDTHFVANYVLAHDVVKATNGAFNPAIMPLVNYWGFGFEKAKAGNYVDTAEVNQLLTCTDFSAIKFAKTNDNHATLVKHKSCTQLDFSAIAKGYAVDEVVALLENRQVKNLLVEIGGEVFAKGLNSSGKAWQVAIQYPEEESQKTFTTFSLDNKAMATSGNYENYQKLKSGETIAHTINPYTGFPQRLNERLLSVTVFASNCATADAFATAFKVMGLEKSLELVNTLPVIDVVFIYVDEWGELHQQATCSDSD